jgi:hypothetical protein
VLLEFSLGKLACEVDQWNRRPPSRGLGISLSLDLTSLTRVSLHRANLIRQGYPGIVLYIIYRTVYKLSMMGLEESMVEGSISLDRL